MRAPNLGLALQPETLNAVASPLQSPRTPNSPSPVSPLEQESFPHHSASPAQASPHNPSPRLKSAKTFFSNPMASRSTPKLSKSTSPSRNRDAGAMSQVFQQTRAMGSSPDSKSNPLRLLLHSNQLKSVLSIKTTPRLMLLPRIHH